MQEVINHILRARAIPKLALLLTLALGTYYPANAWTRESMAIRFEASKPVLDSIVLLSPDVYCAGSQMLSVRGTNVTWYADPNKTMLLGRGNTFITPALYKTTTFYLTQTVGGIESPVKAFSIEIVEATLTEVNMTPASCGKNNGTITAIAVGGSVRNPIQYRLDNGPYQLSPIFKNLSPGTYTVASHAGNCSVSVGVTVIRQPATTITAIDSTAPKCGNADGAIVISASGGTGRLRYSLNGIDFYPDNHFDNLASGTYTVSVRDDSLCTVSRIIELSDDQSAGPCGNTLYLPSSFTPNQDGINDTWAIFFPAASLQLEELILYNRWGEVVYRRSPGPIRGGQSVWNGTYKEVILNGLFTYQLEVRFDNGQKHVYRGTVALL